MEKPSLIPCAVRTVPHPPSTQLRWRPVCGFLARWGNDLTHHLACAPELPRGWEASLPCSLVVSWCVGLLTATLGAIFVDARTVSVTLWGQLDSCIAFPTSRSLFSRIDRRHLHCSTTFGVARDASHAQSLPLLARKP